MQRRSDRLLHQRPTARVKQGITEDLVHGQTAETVLQVKRIVFSFRRGGTRLSSELLEVAFS